MLIKIERYNCQNDHIWVIPQYLFWRWLGHFPSTGSILNNSKFWFINSLLPFILVKRTSWISYFTNLLSEMEKKNCIRTSALGSIIFLISKFLGDISFLVFLFSRLLFQRLLLLNCYFADVLIRTCYYCGSERMMLSKSCTQYVRGSGRPSSGHRTRKGQSSSQFPRRVVLKNIQIKGELQSSPLLVRSCLKFCMLNFSIMWTKNF